MTLLRDPDYYITDGNTVLLVENTLFKVHRSNLIKDNSTFNGMFSMDAHKPDGIQGTEGESDENPIRLLGDTADEFRALMWSLYALPFEVPQKVLRKSVVRFCDLGRIAHKYQFQSLESWTIKALIEFVSVDTDNCNKFRKAGKPNLDKTHTVKITELAVRLEHADLLAAVTVQWKCFIRDGQCLGLAIDMAERLGLKNILGLAYHSMMLKGRAHWNHLTRAQRIRLLSGYHTISQMCEELPSTPPTLTHDPRCGSPISCTQVWNRWWHMTHGNEDLARMNKLQRVNLLGKITNAEGILKAVVADHTAMILEKRFPGMHPACPKMALKAVHENIEEINGRLADIFTDVE